MKLSPLDPGVYRDIVRRALEEDLGGRSDITTEASVDMSARGRGVVYVNDPFRRVDILRELDLACDLRSKQAQPGRHALEHVAGCRQ